MMKSNYELTPERLLELELKAIQYIQKSDFDNAYKEYMSLQKSQLEISNLLSKESNRVIFTRIYLGIVLCELHNQKLDAAYEYLTKIFQNRLHGNNVNVICLIFQILKEFSSQNETLRKEYKQYKEFIKLVFDFLEKLEVKNYGDDYKKILENAILKFQFTEQINNYKALNEYQNVIDTYCYLIKLNQFQLPYMLGESETNNMKEEIIRLNIEMNQYISSKFDLSITALREQTNTYNTLTKADDLSSNDNITELTTTMEVSDSQVIQNSVAPIYLDLNNDDSEELTENIAYNQLYERPMMESQQAITPVLMEQTLENNLIPSNSTSEGEDTEIENTESQSSMEKKKRNFNKSKNNKTKKRKQSMDSETYNKVDAYIKEVLSTFFTTHTPSHAPKQYKQYEIIFNATETITVSNLEEYLSNYLTHDKLSIHDNYIKVKAHATITLYGRLFPNKCPVSISHPNSKKKYASSNSSKAESTSSSIELKQNTNNSSQQLETIKDFVKQFVISALGSNITNKEKLPHCLEIEPSGPIVAEEIENLLRLTVFSPNASKYTLYTHNGKVIILGGGVATIASYYSKALKPSISNDTAVSDNSNNNSTTAANESISSNTTSIVTPLGATTHKTSSSEVRLQNPNSHTFFTQTQVTDPSNKRQKTTAQVFLEYQETRKQYEKKLAEDKRKLISNINEKIDLINDIRSALPEDDNFASFDVNNLDQKSIQELQTLYQSINIQEQKLQEVLIKHMEKMKAELSGIDIDLNINPDDIVTPAKPFGV